MQILTASEPAKAEKSNEDWYSASPGLLVVLDGATARTETGCRHGVSWYAAHLGAALSTLAADRSTSLRGALASAIETVAQRHAECDLSSPGTPSAAVAVVRFLETQIEFLVLGDVSVIIDMPTELRVITDERVEYTAVAERREADRFPIGSPEKSAALVRMKHAELAMRNREGGFWVAAADPSVTRYAITDAVPLQEVRRCAVLTDGAARIVRLFGLLGWSELLDLLNKAGPEELLRRVRELELADPFGRKWPRNKRSDDATAVYAASLTER